jgi:osmotically-inducible protein OsmY/sporulation protein YlmC with PRC-barrel domain
MAKRSAGGWGPEEEERARTSVNRDLGLPWDYDAVTKRFQGDVLSEEEHRETASGRGMPQDRYEREAERMRASTYAQDRPVRPRSADRGWEPPGRYAGRGPRGYRRSDVRIREEVCDRLTVAGSVDATNIEVDVRNGEVRLAGTVFDRYQKRYAEDVALSVYGVDDVQNELRIEQGRSREQEYGTQEQYEPQRPDREYEERGRYEAGGRGGSRERPQIPGPEDWGQLLRRGMEVVDVHGELVGRVKEISEIEFLVDRRFARDVYIPFDAIRNVGEKVYIRMDREQIEDRIYGYPMTSW